MVGGGRGPPRLASAHSGCGLGAFLTRKDLFRGREGRGIGGFAPPPMRRHKWVVGDPQGLEKGAWRGRDRVLVCVVEI